MNGAAHHMGQAAAGFVGAIPPLYPRDNLQNEWLFHGDAEDTSVNSNDGTINGPTLTTDRFGIPNRAFNFTGSPDDIRKISPTLGLSGNFTGTIFAWVIPSLIDTQQTVLACGSATSLNAWAMLFTASNQIQVAYSGGHNCITTETNLISVGVPVFIGISKTPGAINSTTKIYVNGVNKVCTGSSGIPNFINSDLRSGEFLNSAINLTGIEDDNLIYNRDFSAVEHLAVYNDSKP